MWQLCPPNRARGVMYGKEMEFPRWNQMFDKHSYRFAGSDHAPVPITHPFLKQLQTFTEHLESALQIGHPIASSTTSTSSYEDMLLGFYGGGYDYIGAHRDNEKKMINERPIF
jgi:alkylated DNA repair dioxygenase AlkB